jgi:prepilin signal peptidase PulO-like enzyme (type II secretory pathway)
VVGLALAALQRRSMQTKLPFGTFLAVAAYMASIVGDDLLSWYLSIY